MPYYDEEAAPRCRRKGNHGPDDCPACEAEEAYWKGLAEFHAEERARDEAELPTDAEVDAISAELAPVMEEFRARERAKEREAV